MADVIILSYTVLHTEKLMKAYTNGINTKEKKQFKTVRYDPY